MVYCEGSCILYHGYPCKYEIPVTWFPCRGPVNPCKHLQCIKCCISKLSNEVLFVFENNFKSSDWKPRSAITFLGHVAFDLVCELKWHSLPNQFEHWSMLKSFVFRHSSSKFNHSIKLGLRALWYDWILCIYAWKMKLLSIHQFTYYFS